MWSMVKKIECEYFQVFSTVHVFLLPMITKLEPCIEISIRIPNLLKFVGVSTTVVEDEV
jgi:hypothetical protein